MTDTKQVYSNGTEYVPIFRMEQWFEHEKAQLSQEDATSDTIDRQAVIKVLECWQKAFKENSHHASASDLSLVVKDIRALSATHVATDTNVGDKISKFIDGLEETFAYIREREGGDSVCGLCEYDGAYIGESGDWCNECPGFNRDDCFKLSDKTRKEWTEEIIKALPTVQPEPKWIPCSERMPEPRIDVWVNSDLGQMVGYYDDTTELWYGRNYLELIVNAWMPLPEPYKSNNE